MFSTVLFVFAIALQLAVVVALVYKYLRTRDAGFIWLGVAVIVWPSVSGLLNYEKHTLFNNILQGHLPGFYPFSLIQNGQISIGNLFTSLSLLQSLIGGGLLLVAVLSLHKTKGGNKPLAVA
jgi:hypothetical protein